MLFGIVASAVLVGACAPSDREDERTTSSAQVDRDDDRAAMSEPGSAGTSGISSASNDQAITSEVEANILAIPELESDIAEGRIEVQSNDGVVTLTGEVDSEREKEDAMWMAIASYGVTEVENNLKVS
jgi:osmotically-inducible protein OsmY